MLEYNVKQYSKQRNSRLRDSTTIISSVQVLNMNEFKEELSQLLRRYASAEATNNNKALGSTMALSNQQILDAIHEVLPITLNINLLNAELNVQSSELKTPANEIVITTPNAPEILRMDYNKKNLLQNKCTSFESKIEEKSSNRFNSMTNENGPLSTLESGFQKIQDNLEQKDMPKFDAAKKIMMYNMVEDAHKDAMKVVHKLEDLRELLLPEARPVRRLSVIMNLPKSEEENSSTTWNNLRTKNRSAALTRRSMPKVKEEVPVTPTSSRPSLVMPSRTSLPEQKSAEAGTTATPRSRARKFSLQNCSANTLVSKSNKSAGVGGTGSSSNATSKGGSVKNLKYAHVKSTIPKPTSLAVKRKV